MFTTEYVTDTFDSETFDFQFFSGLCHCCHFHLSDISVIVRLAKLKRIPSCTDTFLIILQPFWNRTLPSANAKLFVPRKRYGMIYVESLFNEINFADFVLLMETGGHPSIHDVIGFVRDCPLVGGKGNTNRAHPRHRPNPSGIPHPLLHKLPNLLGLLMHRTNNQNLHKN